MVLEAQMAVTAAQHSTTEFQRQLKLLIILYQTPQLRSTIHKATNRTLLIHPKTTSVRRPQPHKIPLQSIKALQVLCFHVKTVAQLLRHSGGGTKAAEQYVTPAVRVTLGPDLVKLMLFRVVSQASRRTSPSRYEKICHQA